MKNLTRIGLDPEKSAELAGKLNELLANYQVMYMNTRGFHWNIRGEKFFELHLKFEELYNDLILKIEKATGEVEAVINAAGLLTPGEAAEADVLNGIAYDEAKDVFYITGKLWPSLFEVKFVQP